MSLARPTFRSSLLSSFQSHAVNCRVDTPYIRLDNVAVDLPPAVRRLQGTFVQPVRTTGDGACAIHSVWGNPLEGMLFKADARKFLGDAFGSNAQIFKSKLSSKELFADLEVAVWEQILPLAKKNLFQSSST